jgi:uncharacterized protein YjbI with pentapeptide repeats
MKALAFLKDYFLTFSVTMFFYQVAEAGNPAAKDLGYRFQWDTNTHSGRCLNSEGKEGYNPHFIGNCGDLRGLKLNNVDLNGMDLAGANLDGVSLRGAMLNGASMKGVRATGADFSKADLNGADYDGAIVSGCYFNRARMNGANFYGANLSGSKLNESQLHGIYLQNANLGGAIIESEMKTAHVENATITVGTVLPFEMPEAQKRGMKHIQLDTSVAKSSVKDKEEKKDERKPASK